MMQHFYRRLSAAFLLSFLFTMARAQVQIVVPAGPDTVVCDGQPLTLRAVTNGRSPHILALTVDDDYSAVIPIGFSFNFYGNTYTQCLISSNGFVSFNTANAGGYSNWSITTGVPGNTSCLNSVMGEYSDIYPVVGGTIDYSTVGTAPNRKFVASFCQVPLFSCNALKVSFQIILYETTNIAEVHIGNKVTCTSWNSGACIEGVQNSSGSAATIAPGRNYPGTWNANADGRRFTPDSAFTTYTCDTIPYAPIPDSLATIYWYNQTTGALIGMGDTITVTPTVPTVYTAKAISCDTSIASVTVTIGTGPDIDSIITVAPSYCGDSDATMTLYGISPEQSDTVTYTYNGVTQPSLVDSATVDSSITLTGLSAGTYTNITVKVGYCATVDTQVITILNPPITIGDIVITTTPQVCGDFGTIVLHGILPGLSDTVTYSLGGVPQTPLATTAQPDSTIIISNLLAGTYSDFILKYGSECISAPTGSVTIQNPPVIISGITYNGILCAQDTANITLFGLAPNRTYTIYFLYNNVGTTAIETSDANGDIFIGGLPAGTYTNFVASLSPACVSDTNTTSITLVTPPPRPITIDTFTNPTTCGVCDGYIVIGGLLPNRIDTVMFNKNDTAQTPYIGQVGPYGTIALSGLCAGTYDIVFIGQQDTCETGAAGPVNLVKPDFLPAYTYHINYGCTRDTVVYTDSSVTTGTVYRIWKFGDGTTDTAVNPIHVFNTQDTFHTTLYINNGYCFDSVMKTINLIHPNLPSFTASSDTICQGQTIAFTNTSVGTPDSLGSGPYYMWSYGDGTTDSIASPTHTFTNAGSYHVVMTERNFIPCADTTGLLVQVDSISSLVITASDSAICAGKTITFNANYSNIGNTGINWNFSDGSMISGVNPVQHSFDYSGAYPQNFNVTATATYRVCPDTTTVKTVTILPYPNVNIGPDTALCPNSTPLVITDTVNINDPAATWVWNTGDSTGRITVNAPGLYYTTVTKNGCTNSDSITVRNDCYINIPNAFTPNGDGENDYFFPRQMLSSSISTFKMDIYNRWGQLIFETTNPDGRGWDGKMSGDVQPEGVYIYIIDATFKNGQSEHHQGNITLLR